MFGLGFTEVVVILVVALIFLGPEKLPEVARSLGKVMGELRRTTDDLRRDILYSGDDDPQPPRSLAASPLSVASRGPNDPVPSGVVDFAPHDGDLPHNCEHCSSDAEAAAAPPADSQPSEAPSEAPSQALEPAKPTKPDPEAA